MCTCLIAGRKTTVSGNVMLGANDDWDGVKGLLTHVPRALHAGKWDIYTRSNTHLDRYILTGGASIPQVPETCGYVYTACDYAIGTLDRGWAGGVNDCGVAVAGTGVDAYRPLDWKDKGWLLEPDDIPLLILQRGTSARQAVRMIGDLINTYGLRPSYIEGSAGSSAATFSIADQEEGWVLEVYPGRCWVAVRVPDDAVSVRVNAFGTHDADLTDEENTISSPGLAEYARRMLAEHYDEAGHDVSEESTDYEGTDRDISEESLRQARACSRAEKKYTCIKEDKSIDIQHFDFAAIFGSETSPTEWGPEKDPMNLRRRWRAMYLVDGIEEPEETLRYLAYPGLVEKEIGKRTVAGKRTGDCTGGGKNTEDRRENDAKGKGSCAEIRGRGLIKEDFMQILSDVYEGTPYDLTRVPEAGPVHDPFADDLPDYALCRRGTIASFVTDYAGQPLMWVAMGTPRLVPYIPVWVDINSLPACCGRPLPRKSVRQPVSREHMGQPVSPEYPGQLVSPDYPVQPIERDYPGQEEDKVEVAADLSGNLCGNSADTGTLYEKMRQYADGIRRRYDEKIAKAENIKAEFQAEMEDRIREEARAEKEKRDFGENQAVGSQNQMMRIRNQTMGGQNQTTGSQNQAESMARTERTEQTAAHIRRAVEIFTAQNPPEV